MKKLLSFLTLSLLFGYSITNAQNQRTVVLECFTSASCSPCAQYNPALDNIINNNADHLIAIKYHVNWPTDTDPMNHHNPSEVASRRSYYNVNSVPYSIGDGTWSNTSNYVTQNLVDQLAAVDSPLEMRMMNYLNATQDTIFVVVMGHATAQINSNNLRLHISVLEKTMEYASAPSSNGERIFHNVMKKMLPSASGTALSAMQAGDYFAYEYSWALANVMNINELTAVAWVQDNSTKEVFQGCKSTDDFLPFYNKQAQISKSDHTKGTICSSRVNPDIFVTNFGSEAINSLNFSITVNGTSVGDFSWQGNINFGETAKVNFGELYFENVEIMENNEMIFQINQVNGAPDDYAPGTYRYSFSEAKHIVNKTFKLTIKTDDEPQLITWEVKNADNNEVVVSGGPYEEAHKQYTESFNLEDDACYTFTIYDAGGNGLQAGQGVYGLKAGSQTIVAGSDFTDMESNDFSFSKQSGVDENSDIFSNIYPNPSNGMINIDAEGDNNIAVYNMTGHMVYNQAITGKTTVDLTNLEKGTYLIVLKNQNGDSTKQIIVLQ